MIIVKTSKEKLHRVTKTYDVFNTLNVRLTRKHLGKGIYQVVCKVNDCVVSSSCMTYDMYEALEGFIQGLQRINTKLLGKDINLIIDSSFYIADELVSKENLTTERIESRPNMFTPHIMVSVDGVITTSETDMYEFCYPEIPADDKYTVGFYFSKRAQEYINLVNKHIQQNINTQI